ncbi:radical SAM protein [Nannocystis sp. ILAH1]|uniref:radical SAM/SPASM domain-containing protein n=1 Tax=unclassified Nannocystis TaxID=2627009 RepID=UPI00226FA4A7|nr:radical SAM protein [Nannocystis sp. ILAH1]MCY1067824.1 radical SAM protein [Nannocystis sp. RBIL2]
MGIREERRRLPIVALAPPTRSRRALPVAAGQAPVPRIVVWEFTSACDQHCAHCGPRSGKRRPDELSTAEALRLVEELAAAGVGEVTLIGGEAYLRPDVLQIVRAIRERGMSCTMTTGGYSLTGEIAEALVEAGVQSVSVSIDGLAACHDALRGRPNSFQRAFAALRHLKAAGSQISANTQLNAKTLPDLEPLLELLHAEGIHSWQVQVTMAHGAAADHPEILLQPYQMLPAYEVVERLLGRCEALGIRLYPGNSLGYFGPLEHRLRRNSTQRGHYFGCQAGISGAAVSSHGEVKSCPSLGEEGVGGSWREHGFAALWERAPEIVYMRQRTRAELWGRCASCYYASVCMGGCTSMSEPLLGRPGNNPMCHHRALELDREGLRERIEPVRAAPGQPFDHGLFRLILEHKDPELRARHGPLQIDEPRRSRVDEPNGPGSPLE